jgi:hypothetical protein
MSVGQCYGQYHFSANDVKDLGQQSAKPCMIMLIITDYSDPLRVSIVAIYP